MDQINDIPMTPRRNSTGNFSIPKSEVVVLSRYLSASVGSCHDNCKYGIKHDLENKARIRIPKRTTGRPGEGQYRAKDANLQEIEKKSEIKNQSKKVSVHSKHFSCPGNGNDKKPIQCTKLSHCCSKFWGGSDGNRTDDSAKCACDLRPKPKPSSYSIPRHSMHRRHSDVIIRKGVGVLPESPVGGPRRSNCDVNTSKEKGMSKYGVKKRITVPIVSTSPKSPIKRELGAKFENFEDPRKVSHPKSFNDVRNAESKQAINENIPEKMLYVIETKPENPVMGLTQNGDESSLFSDKKMEHGLNGMHSSQSPPSSENKKQNRIRNGVYKTRSSSSSSLSPYRRSLICTQNGKHNAPSSSSNSMKNDGSDPISEGSVTESQNQIQHQEVECANEPRMVGKVGLEDEAVSHQKCNFRRGKVVDVHSEAGSPRRLRFKQRMVLAENQNGYDANAKGIRLQKVVTTDELNGSKTEPMKVVLRHQALGGNKDGQNLSSNVVEETASMLVKTWKGKVKALVGAFETLISLQDTKPSATFSAN